jgi:hypothetical protein
MSQMDPSCNESWYPANLSIIPPPTPPFPQSGNGYSVQGAVVLPFLYKYRLLREKSVTDSSKSHQVKLVSRFFDLFSYFFVNTSFSVHLLRVCQCVEISVYCNCP